MNKPFSTGSGELDRYLGGVGPGDSVLIMQGEVKDSRPLLKVFTDHVRGHDHTLRYLNLNDSWTPLLTGVRVRGASPGGTGALKSAALYRWASARIHEIGRGETVVMDDLAEWERLLGPGGKIVSLVGLLSKTVARKKSFVLMTVTRGGVGIRSLAAIKDIVDISLELTFQEGDLLLHALHTRKRLPVHAGFPFGFRLSRGKGKKVLSAIPDFHHGPGNTIRTTHEERERIAENLFRGPFNFRSTGVAVADLSGTYRAANEFLLDQLGLTGSDFISTAATGFIQADDRRKFLRFIAEAKTRETTSAELALRSASGQNRPVHVLANRIDAGLHLLIVRDNRDGEAALRASRRRDAEHAQLFDEAPYALCVADGRKILRSNAAFQSLLRKGGPAAGSSTVEGQLSMRECFEAKFLRRIRASMSELLPSPDSATPVVVEGDLLRPGATALPVRVTLSTAAGPDRGKFRLYVEDISPWALRISTLESNDRQYRGIAEGMTRAAGLLRDQAFTYANASLARLLGFENGTQLAGTVLSDRIPEGERTKLGDGPSSHRGQRKEAWVVEASVARSDSTLFPARLSFRRMHGNPEADTMVEIEDLSRLKSEEARLDLMQQGSERIRNILEASTATLDQGKLLHTALEKSLEILGWSGGIVYTLDPAAKIFTQALHRKIPRKLLSKISEFPADEGLGGFVHKTLESHVIDIDAYPSYLPMGTLFREHGVRRISLVPLVHGESPLGFILGVTDGEGGDHPAEVLTILGRQLGNAIANSRKLTDVKESEGKLHRVVDSMAGIVYTSGPDGIIRSIDQPVSGLLGYAGRDFSRNSSLYLSLIHEEDKKIYLERVTASDSLPPTFVRVYRMRPKAKASYLWVRDSVSVMRDGQGHVTGFTGLLSDVTGDLEKLREVQTERSVLRSVQDVIPDGIAAFDSAGKCVEWNPTMERITGRGRTESLGRLIGDIVPLPPGVTAETLNEKLRGGGAAGVGLIAAASADGKRHEVTLVPVPGNRGDAPGFLLRYTDVTEREKELHELLESERILLNVLNAMDDVMMITDLGGRVVEVNQAFLRCTGYPRSEVVGQVFPYPWLDENDMGRFLEWISRIRDQRWLHDFDLTWITRAGSKVRMSLNTTPIRNSYGEPVAMLNIARDITERVRLTSDLESRNIQIEMINRVITLANVSDDFSEIFGTVAREVMRVVPSHAVLIVPTAGLDPSFTRSENFGPEPVETDEVLPLVGAFRTFAGVAHVVGDLLHEAPVPLPESLTARIRSAVLVPLAPGGRPVGMFVVANREPHAYTEEHASLLVPLVHQIGGIIERTRLFRQVASDSTYVRNLLNSIDSPVYTVDSVHTITQINRAGAEFLGQFTGVERPSLEGANLFSILPESTLRATLEQGVREGDYSTEIPVTTAEGEKIIRVTVNSLREGGEISGYVFSHADITNLKKTESELRERAQQLITLHEISTLIGNSFDINLVLRSALPMLKSAIGADAVIVYLPGQGEGDLVLEHQEGFLPADVDTIRVLNPDSTVTGDVVRKREAHYIERDVERDPRISPGNRAFLKTHGMKAMGVIPILVKDKVLGAIDIFYRADHPFLEGERHILNLVTNQIGAAIENALLYRELTAQVDRLSILFELSRSLTSLLDTRQICREVFDHLLRVAPCRRCTISLLDRQTGTLKTKLHAESGRDGFTVTAGAEGDDRTDGTAVSEVLGGRKTYRSDDRTLVIVPMVSENTLTGIIEVVAAGEGFDEVQCRLLESIGSLTAIALEKGSLYEETVAKSDEITQRNRELDDFTYVVSHDLKEPLISIEGFSRILQADYSEVIREEGREYLGSLVGATTRMKGLIDDLLELSRVSRPSESFGPVDVTILLGEIRTDMEYLLRKRGVSLLIPEKGPVVRGNGTQLKILFRNLIANGVKFNDKPHPEVEVGFRIHENNSYLFWVRDNGIGIEPEFFSKIFVIFQRLHRREEFEGSGAGLAIVKKIIETHQGKIWVESVKGSGSTFFFILPAQPQP